MVASAPMAISDWTEADITTLAQRWLADPATNFGLIVEGESEGSVQYSIAAREWSQSALRPRLVVSYRSGNPDADDDRHSDAHAKRYLYANAYCHRPRRHILPRPRSLLHRRPHPRRQ